MNSHPKQCSRYMNKVADGFAQIVNTKITRRQLNAPTADGPYILVDRSFSGGRNVTQRDEAKSTVSIADAKRNAEKANEAWETNRAASLKAQLAANEQIKRANALLRH